MSGRRIRAAAIQMETQIADIEGNISQAGDLAEKALRGGATFVALPEFFTTQIVLDERLWSCSLPAENDALRMMRSLASAYGAVLGGSYLEFDQGDVYNTYVLVSPDGLVSKHRKDLPTMAENAYYIGGHDDGLVKCEDMDVGIAVCWETIRSATARRLRAKCDLVMSGSHWWSAPEWGFARSYFSHHARLNADHMFRAPGRFARLVGAPLLHGAHCGMLEGRYALAPNWSVPVRTHLVGETQIVDASGMILARRSADEGAGFISAEIVTGRRLPDLEVPRTFWLESLPPLVGMMWATQNAVCRKIYDHAKKNGKIRLHGARTAEQEKAGRLKNKCYRIQTTPLGDRKMTDADSQTIAQRNKANYLKAKAAFNEKDMAGCMSYYALDHQIRSRAVGPGREHIEQFLSSMHANWADLKIEVDHAIAEGDWVAGRCTSTAVHSKPVMGVAPTGREVLTTFWDMHRFNTDGKIAETWNLTDSLAIMQQLGLVPSG